MRETGYIFDMRSLLTHLTVALALASMAPLRADPADVAGSHDYPGFPRVPGYILTDFVEDNPSEFDFPVSRPQPLDAGHVETVHVHGHRFIIRYELGPGVPAPSLLQTQLYYEKLAAIAGFVAEKTGAVGDVTETFHQTKDGRETWVYLEPAVTANVLTIVESSDVVAVTPPPPPRISAVASAMLTPAAVQEPSPAPPAAPKPVVPSGEALYEELNQQGRVVVPINFVPGQEEIDHDSDPVVASIVDMMRVHPEIFLRIESHTDNTGDPEDNMRLSGQRAYAIRAMLIADNVAPDRLDAVGVGGLQPIADNDTEEGRAKNRRIELVIKKRFNTSSTAVQ